jgi:uncharacterized membrane protein
MKTVFYVTILILSIAMALVLYAHNAVFLLDGPDNGFLLTKTAEVRESIYLPAFYVHIVTGSIVLIAGVLQLSTRLRLRFPALHRSLGKTYVLVVLLCAAPSGLVMAFYANGGFAAGSAFGILAILWWYFTWRGLHFARKKEWHIHREFMLRSFTLTFSAVTLRLYSFIFALAGFRGESVYILVAWLCWVPSIMGAEIWIRKNALNAKRRTLNA